MKPLREEVGRMISEGVTTAEEALRVGTDDFLVNPFNRASSWRARFASSNAPTATGPTPARLYES